MQIGGLAILKTGIIVEKHNVMMCGTGITSVLILWDNREKEYIRKQYKAVSSDADGPFAIS